MIASIFAIHTGWVWLNVVVCVISGSAGIGILILLPRYLRETVIPMWRVLQKELLNIYDKPPEDGKNFSRKD